MPVYQFEGVHYSLPDGLSNEQAKNKILVHLGRASKDADVGTPPPPPDLGKSAFDKIPGSTPMPGSGPDPEEDWLDKLTGVGQAAAQTLSGGIGYFGGAIQGAQALANGKSLQEADQIAGQQMSNMTYEPTRPAGVRYGEKVGQVFNDVGLPAIAHLNGIHTPSLGDIANQVRARAPEAPVAPRVEPTMAPPEPPVQPPASLPTPRMNPADLQHQTLIDDTQHVLPDTNQLYASQYGVEHGVGRVDENGMPIRADLSMDAQNVQNPLQRNLWGDELPNMHEQQEPSTLTQALDSLPKGPARDAALERISGESVKAPELGKAVDEANALASKEQDLGNPDLSPLAQPEESIAPLGSLARKALMKKQGGKMDVDLQTFGVSKLIDLIRNYEPVAPLRSLLKKFEGTFTKDALKAAYREAHDPKSRTSLYLMNPYDFHKVAQQRSPDLLARDAAERRFNINAGIDKDGVDALPRLTLNSEGKVTWHNGRHRMDVAIERGLDKVPVLIEHAFARNGENPFVNFTHITPEISGEGSKVPMPPRALSDAEFNADPHPAYDQPMNVKRVPGPDGEGMATIHVSKTIPKSQRGGINVDAVTEGYKKLHDAFVDHMVAAVNLMYKHGDAAQDYFSKNLPEARKALEGRIAKPPTPEESIGRILDPGATDTPSIWENVQSGLTLAAAKFKNNPLLLDVGRHLNYAMKVGEFQVREMVHPVQKFVASLALKEKKGLYNTFKDEMFANKRFTPEELAAKGFTDKQMNAYKMMRAAFDNALDIQNKGRELLGMKPVTSKEAYLASTWNGNWHLPITKETVDPVTGKTSSRLVWYIRTQSKSEGMKALKYLRKTQPDLKIPDNLKPSYRDSSMNPRAGNDVMGAYHDMLGYFSDQPEIASQIRDALQDFLEEKGYSASGQHVHFLEKNNIRGFLGDRPWKSENENTFDGLHAQMAYLKGATKWAHQQEAIANIKQITTDPKVVAKMPNAVEYAKTVIARELGLDTNMFNKLENFIAKRLGVSPGSLYGYSNGLKTMTYLQILGMSPAYMIATPLQAIFSASWHRTLTTEGYKHSGIQTSLLALSDASLGIAQHLSHEMGKEVRLPLTAIGQQALRYAEDAGIISRNLVDESEGLGADPIKTRLKTAVTGTIAGPEKVARLSTFMAFVHHLEQSGKFTDKLEMFRKADEMTDNSMTSFKNFDRPGIVSKLGVAGPPLYMFKSFVFNGFNQLSAHARLAAKGTPSPLLAALGLYAVMGGVQNIPMMNELDGAWNVLKDGVAKFFPQHYEHVEGLGPKAALINILPQSHMLRDMLGYGLPSALSNIQLASRLNLQAFDPERPLQGAAPIVQEMKEVGGIAGAAINPTGDQAMSGLYVNSPPMVQGNLETRVPNFKVEGRKGVYYKPQDLPSNKVQGHVRTPFDVGARQVGMTSLAESRDKEVQYINNAEEARIHEAQTNLMERAMNAIKSHDNEKVKYNIIAALRLSPDGIDLNKAIDEGILNMKLTPMEQKAMKLRTVQQIKYYQRYQGMNQ